MSDEKDPKVEKAFKELCDKFPSRYKVKGTTYLKALLYAIAEGDGYIDSQVDAVSDNSLVVTASGKYLDRLGSLYGVGRGRATGVQDSDFQKLIPTIGNNPKQIISTLQKVIDYIYGPYASHANTSCSAPAPYRLFDGAKLRVRCDDKEIDIYFKSSDAIDISRATAQEVATAISERTQGKVVGSVVLNVRTGEEFINLRTSTIGSQGFIQVLGGEAQGAMRFPEIRPTRMGIGQYKVSRYKGTDEIEFTLLSGISPACRTAGVRTGDLITISESSGFHEKNCGTFKVSFVSENDFRVVNPNGEPEESVTHLSEDDFTFYRPDLGNILLTARPATILHTAQRELTVILPVTSPIVKRTLRGSHHFHCGLSNVTKATNSTVTLASPSGFKAPGSFHKVGNREMVEGSVSSVSGNNITMITGEGWPSSGAIYSPTERQFYYYKSKSGNTLSEVTPTPPTSLAGTILKYNKKYSFTGIDGDTLTGVTPNPQDIVGHDISSHTETIDAFPGSFLYDLNSPYAISDQSTYLTEKIQQGSSRTVVGVGDVSDWDKDGYFMVAYGTKEEEGPIRYLNKVGQEALIIDPGHVFDRDHLKGISIRRVRHLGPAIPRVNGQDLPVYITGTSQARTLLAEYLRSLVAAGVVLKFKIIVPEQKWPVLPLLYSTNPLEDDLAIKQPEDERSGGNNLPPSAPPPPAVALVFDPVVVPAPPAEPEPTDPVDPGTGGGGTGSGTGWVAPVLSGTVKRFTNEGSAFRAELSWGAIDGATAYKIWKGGSEFNPEVVIEVPPGTSYVDYNTPINRTVTYKIQAIKGSNLTGYEATGLSNTISLYIDPGTEIDTTSAPNITLNYVTSNNRVYIQNEPVDDWIHPFSSIKYFRGEVVNGVFSSAVDISNTIRNEYYGGAYDPNPVVGSTHYYYIVHAIADGRSKPSNKPSVAIGAQGVNVTMTSSAPTLSTLEINTSCNSIAQGSSYTLTIKKGAATVHTSTKNTVGSTITFDKFSNPEHGTLYTATVVVKNSSGVEINTGSSTHTTQSRPSQPTFKQWYDDPSHYGRNGFEWTNPSGARSIYIWNNSSSAPSSPTGTLDSSYPTTMLGTNDHLSGQPASEYNKTWYLHVWSVSNNNIASATPLTIGPILPIDFGQNLMAEDMFSHNSIKISSYNPNKGGAIGGVSSIKIHLYKNDDTFIKTVSFGSSINDQVISVPTDHGGMIKYRWEYSNSFTTYKVPSHMSYGVWMKEAP